MKRSKFLNKLNWYCTECTCFRISYSASSNASKTVRSSCTATHTRSCFVIQYFASWWEDIVSNPDCLVLQFRLNFTCFLHLPL